MSKHLLLLALIAVPLAIGAYHGFPIFDDGYYAVVDVERVVAAKVSPGGTAPERIAEQLTLARSVLARIGAHSPSAAPHTGPHPAPHSPV